MPSNSAEYQRQYRVKTKNSKKEISVSLPIGMYREFSVFANKHKMSLARLMRESTDLQIRGQQMKGQEIESELKELRFLISNIANNVNQMARHSNRLRQVTNENDVFQSLQELQELVTKFTNNRFQTDRGLLNRGAEKNRRLINGPHICRQKNQTTVMICITTVLDAIQKILPINSTPILNCYENEKTAIISIMR